MVRGAGVNPGGLSLLEPARLWREVGDGGGEPVFPLSLSPYSPPTSLLRMYLLMNTDWMDWKALEGSSATQKGSGPLRNKVIAESPLGIIR